MNRILRSIFDITDNKGHSTIPLDDLAVNLAYIQENKFEFGIVEDREIYSYIQSFFSAKKQCPHITILEEVFEKREAQGCIDRLTEVKQSKTYTKANFEHLVDEVLESERDRRFKDTITRMAEISSTGINLKEGRHEINLKGVPDAYHYFLKETAEIMAPHENKNNRTFGEIRTDIEEVKAEYFKMKTDPSHGIGRFTGLANIDLVLRGVKEGHLWLHAASTGELKCCANAYIYDHNQSKLVTIKELYDKKQLPCVTALNYEGKKDFKLVMAQASHLVQNGIQDTYQLTLESGRSITTTDNHKFFTPNGWREIRHLQVNDWVAVPKQIGIGKFNTNYSDSQLKFIAYLLGDGSIDQNNGIKLTNSKEIIQRDFKNCLISMGLTEGPCDYVSPKFTLNYPENRSAYFYVSRGNSSGNSSVITYDSPAYLLLDKFGLTNKTASEKFIPKEFWGLSDRQLEIFLGALWSTDGSLSCNSYTKKNKKTKVSKTDITYSTISKQLAIDVQSLLLRLGIDSTMHPVNSTYKGNSYVFYCVKIVTNYSKRIFLDKVQVIGKSWDRDALKTRLSKKDGRTIPSCLLPNGMKIEVHPGYTRYSKWAKKRASITVESAKQFLTKEDVFLNETLIGDIKWEQIKFIEFAGMQMTYDLSVPDHHSFVANDIITHNTTFALNWAYNTVTRYGWNVVYYTFEQQYEQIRRQIWCLHSSHPKFLEKGYRPIDYQKLTYGELSPEDEDYFFNVVAPDFNANPTYGKLHVEYPIEDPTIPQLQAKLEILHQRMPVHLVFLDHGGLINPVDAQHRSNLTERLNSVVRSAKVMALSFNHGQGIPIVMLFQINRKGKADADKDDGNYKIQDLSYANEAERSSDVITTTYLNQELRDCGMTQFQCLKSRDGPLFEKFKAKIIWDCKRIYNMQTSDIAGDRDNIFVEVAKALG